MASSSKVKKAALKDKREVKKAGKEEHKAKGSSTKSDQKGKVNEVKSKAGSRASKRKIEEKAKERQVKRSKDEVEKERKRQSKPNKVQIEKEVPTKIVPAGGKDSKAPSAPRRRVSVKSAQQVQEFHPDDPPAAVKGAKLLTPPTKPPLVTPSPSPRGSSASLRELQELSKKKGLSLEDLMQQQSEQRLDVAVESHMKKLIDEQKTKAKAKKGDEAKEEESQEAEGSEDEDEEEDNEEEDPKSDLERESGESLSSEPSSSDSEPEASESQQEEEEEEMNEKKDESQESESEDSNSDTEKQVVALMGPADPAPHAPPAVPLEKQKQVEKAASAQAESFATANSATHKQQYDRFCRQCCDRRRFPVSLAQHCIRDKLDLFRTWLEMNGDWSKVEVTMQRKAENKTKSTKMRSGTKLRDILKLYPEKKAMALVKKLKEKGMWHYDEDFPQDEEEIYYYVGAGNTLKNENITSTSAAVEVKDKNNKELVNALVCEGGALQTGALPSLEVSSEAGAKAVLEAVSSANTVQVKNKKGPKDKDEAKKLEPKTVMEKASDVMDDVLRKGADARKHSISLQTVEYSGDLCQKLMDFSSKMEKIYNHLRDLVVRKVSDPAMFEKHFQIVQEKFQWFEKAEAAAKALKSGMNPKPKKKAKASKKEEKATEDDGGEQVVPAEP